MQKIIQGILIFMIIMYAHTAIAQTDSVTSTEALSEVQKRFTGRDVDYFLVENSSSELWTIFVDAEPLKGWSHESYLFNVSKKHDPDTSLIRILNEQKTFFPPEEALTPLNVKNRNSVMQSSKAKALNNNFSFIDPITSNKTYAIILSGGTNKNSNHRRYWNDCSFIYKTLRNKYGLPKNNIYLLMSDGNNPAEDMNYYDSISNQLIYLSQDLDLDGDGTNDIELAATKQNLYSTFSNIQNKIKKDDTLLLFVTDHGMLSGQNSEICLWNYENINSSELSALISPILNKQANVSAVFGQCFSGGFIQDLEKIGCVAVSACDKNESSYSFDNDSYDVFLYYWICAINGYDKDGNSVNADKDKNGRISMREAFDYAHEMNNQYISNLNHTPYTIYQHGQYSSKPEFLGLDLSFDNPVPSEDVFIKDDFDDYGSEPNLAHNIFWNSPSISIRTDDEGEYIYEHQNPTYDGTLSDRNYINFRIHNKSKNFLNPRKWVHIYWARSSTVILPQTWKGQESYEGYPTGGFIYAYELPSINYEGYVDLRSLWPIPQIMSNLPNSDFNYAILAKIMDTPNESSILNAFDFNVRSSNDVAMKNLVIVDRQSLSNGTNVFIRNDSPSEKNFSFDIGLNKLTSSNSDIPYDVLNVEMEISKDIYNKWKNKGMTSENVVIIGDISNSLYKIIFSSLSGKLKNIKLDGYELQQVKLKFKIPSSNININEKYEYTLYQRDENNQIVGGQTFYIDPKYNILEPLEVVANEIGNGQYKIEIENPNVSKLKWYNADDQLISTNDFVIVSPIEGNNQYSVEGSNNDGEFFWGNICLGNEYVFENIIINKSTSQFEIKLSNYVYQDSEIVFTSYNTGEEVLHSRISYGERNVTMDASNLSKGIYIVNLIVNGKVMDWRTIEFK